MIDPFDGCDYRKEPIIADWRAFWLIVAIIVGSIFFWAVTP